MVINEVLSHSDLPFEDAIEIRNLGTEAVDISDWWLSDARNTPQKYRIEPNTILTPGGYKVFYEYQFNTAEFAALPFALSSAEGDEIFLSAVNANGELTGQRAFVKFGASENSVSFGRWETSLGADFVAMSQRTFGMDNPAAVEEFRTGEGLPNTYPKIGPVVFSEIMYHPAVSNDALEFIELHNITSTNVPLFNLTNSWRIRKGVDFNLPPGSTIPPLGYLVVVSFDPQVEPSALAAFQSSVWQQRHSSGTMGGETR